MNQNQAKKLVCGKAAIWLEACLQGDFDNSEFSKKDIERIYLAWDKLIEELSKRGKGYKSTTL
jgi:hypothetical protein